MSSHLRYVGPDGKADRSLSSAPYPRSRTPSVDREWSDPQAFVRNLQQDDGRATVREVVNGQMGWLPGTGLGAPEAQGLPLRGGPQDEEPLATLPGCLSRPVQPAGTASIIQAMTDRDDHLVVPRSGRGADPESRAGPVDPGHGPRRIRPGRPAGPSRRPSADSGRAGHAAGPVARPAGRHQSPAGSGP